MSDLTVALIALAVSVLSAIHSTFALWKSETALTKARIKLVGPPGPPGPAGICNCHNPRAVCRCGAVGIACNARRCADE